MSSLGFKLNQAGTEQVFDHDKDGKPIPLYNPLTGKHDITFIGQEAFLSHADTCEHLAKRPTSTTTRSGFTTAIRHWRPAWPHMTTE